MATFSLTDDQYKITPYAYYLGIDKKNYVPIYLIDIDAKFDEVKGNTISLGSLSHGDGDNILYKSDPIFQNTSWFTTYGKNDQVYNSFFGDWNDGILSVKNVKSVDNIGRLSYAHKVQIIPKNYTFNTYYYDAVFPPSLADNGRYNGNYQASLLFLYVVHTSDNYYFVNSEGLRSMRQSGTLSHFDANGLPPIILASSKNKGTLPPNAYINLRIDIVSEEDKVGGEAVAYLLGKSKKIDTNDPDPNIDDSDGDKNRTPTADIGGDTVGDDDLPTISVMDTGLVTLYNPTVGELSSLGHFLWSDAFSLDTFKKLFSDPFDTLLGLSILPVTPTVSGRHNIYFGNIDSGVACNVVANQFLKVDMGSLTLSETYASAFDYAPSTQVDIYLPFIGSHGLNTNDVMGSTLHLIYKFDLLSGGCIAELFINHTSQGNKSKGLSYNPNMGLAYTFTGQCSCSIPLTSNNYNGMIQSIIQSVGTVGAIGASVATGNPALGVASVATSATTIGLQANTPTVQRSGSIGSSNALLSCLTPYLSVQRAHICKPGHFYSKRGIPSQVYVDDISSVGSGNYFQIADCADLHASGASDAELTEIKSILTSGAVW